MRLIQKYEYREEQSKKRSFTWKDLTHHIPWPPYSLIITSTKWLLLLLMMATLIVMIFLFIKYSEKHFGTGFQQGGRREWSFSCDQSHCLRRYTCSPLENLKDHMKRHLEEQLCCFYFIPMVFSVSKRGLNSWEEVTQKSRFKGAWFLLKKIPNIGQLQLSAMCSRRQ